MKVSANRNFCNNATNVTDILVKCELPQRRGTVFRCGGTVTDDYLVVSAFCCTTKRKGVSNALSTESFRPHNCDCLAGYWRAQPVSTS